jgi:hypothetical protein
MIKSARHYLERQLYSPMLLALSSVWLGHQTEQAVGALSSPMKRAWTATKAVAIATLVGILATAPVGAFEVRPDRNLTGGAASIRTKDRIAACGHAGENRGRMPQGRQDEVLKRYGLPTGAHPDYEIDHLIPLCLGGSDHPSNLWPQPRRRIEKTWNAEAKQRLERQVCDMVCAGHIDIAEAQEAFATDWIAAYEKYMKGGKDSGRDIPENETDVKARCPTDTVVWVNSTSKVYHFNENRFYGNTKNGAYMCERDAVAAGMRPPKNEKHPRTN